MTLRYRTLAEDRRGRREVDARRVGWPECFELIGTGA